MEQIGISDTGVYQSRENSAVFSVGKVLKFRLKEVAGQT